MIVLPALAQLPAARLRASTVVIYVALLSHLDTQEYRVVDLPTLERITGYGESLAYEALAGLSRAGFLDVRGASPRKYRLLLSQRTTWAVSDAA